MSNFKVGDLVRRKEDCMIPEWLDNEPRKVIAVGKGDTWVSVDNVLHDNGEPYNHAQAYLEKVEDVKPDPMSATELLQRCVSIQQERGKQYDGKQEQERSFKRVADAYNAITHRDLKGSDVALMLQILKDVRLYTNMDSLHEDSILDKVSYASLHGEELYNEFNDN